MSKVLAVTAVTSKEMFYLSTHSTHFIDGYMVEDHSDSERGNPMPPHGLLFLINSKVFFICSTPVVAVTRRIYSLQCCKKAPRTKPVLHDWCNKGHGMYYPVYGMVHIKEPLLLIGKSSPCGGSGFTISPIRYNCK